MRKASKDRSREKNPYQGGISKFHMGGSLILVLLLIIGVLGLVNKINNSLREDTESTIKSMTKIGGDYIQEYVKQDTLCLRELADIVALVPEEKRMGRIQEYVDNDAFSRIALIYPDGSGFFSEGTVITADTDMGWKEFSEDSDISTAFLGWDGRKQVAMRAQVELRNKTTAMLYGYVDLEKYYIPSALEFLDGRGFAYMIDGKTGDYLVYTKNTVAQRTYVSLYEMLEKSGNPGESLEEVKDMVKDGKSGSVVLKTEKTDNYLYFTPVEDTPGWYMTAIVSLDAIQQSGSTILFLVTLVCIFIFLCVIGLMMMENSRKRSAALSKEREYRDTLFGLIAENVEQVFMIYNGHKRQMEMVFQNSRQVLGVDAQTYMHKPMLFFERCESESLKEAGALMLAGQLDRNVSEECRYIRVTDGKLLWVKVKLIRIGGDTDAIQYIVAVEDQTSERNIRRSLDTALMAAEKASKAKSEFLSSMSHDIRTPMNAIMGMTELALLQEGCTGQVRELLEKISSSSRHLLSLINDILDMSRIESGKLNINLRPFKVTEEIERVSNIIQGQAEEREQIFSVKVNRLRHNTLLGDILRINQILINILGNSVKFTPQGGRIDWEITETDDKPGWIRIRHVIADNGVGMQPEFLPHLFDAFEQENRGENPQAGSGLGMAITKSLVDLMGGTITVDSTPGKGTTFVVELCFQIKETEENEHLECVTENPLHSQEESVNMRVLLVDDNSLNREIALQMLSVYDVEAETAENGEQALQEFSRHEPGYYDAILMDIQMPVMDGYVATREIRGLSREDARSVPIIAMTADAFAEDVQKAIDAGMNAHVAKPVDFRQLYMLLMELHKG